CAQTAYLEMGEILADTAAKLEHLRERGGNSGRLRVVGKLGEDEARQVGHRVEERPPGRKCTARKLGEPRLRLDVRRVEDEGVGVERVARTIASDPVAHRFPSDLP